MPILDAGPQQINYVLEGPAGVPVLMLSNSLGTTMSMWDAQAQALKGEFRILRYDTRGHGGSGLGRQVGDGYTLDQLGSDALRLLDGLGIDKVAFCGISLGGLIGLWLGVHAGDRLQRLVIANSAARIGAEAGWRERAAQVTAAGMDTVADGARGRWFTEDFLLQSPSVADMLIESLRSTPPAGYAACCLALARADLRKDISRIQVPTLIVAGNRDPVTTVADAGFMAGLIEGAHRSVLPASHLSNVEAAEAFTHEVRAFLRPIQPQERQ